MRCHHQSSPSMKTQGLCSLFSVLSSSERETLFLNCDDQIEVSNCITFSVLSPSLCLSVFHPPFVCILYFIFDTLKSSSFEDLKSSFFLPPPREKKEEKKNEEKILFLSIERFLFNCELQTFDEQPFASIHLFESSS